MKLESGFTAQRDDTYANAIADLGRNPLTEKVGDATDNPRRRGPGNVEALRQYGRSDLLIPIPADEINLTDTFANR
jgi:hypothetical protein